MIRRRPEAASEYGLFMNFKLKRDPNWRPAIHAI